MKTTLWKVKGATTNPLSKCYQNISLKITSRAQARFTLMSSQWRFQTLSNQHNCRQLFKCTTVICVSVPCKASHCGIVSRKDCTCRGCCFFFFVPLRTLWGHNMVCTFTHSQPRHSVVKCSKCSALHSKRRLILDNLSNIILRYSDLGKKITCTHLQNWFSSCLWITESVLVGKIAIVLI